MTTNELRADCKTVLHVLPIGSSSWGNAANRVASAMLARLDAEAASESAEHSEPEPLPLTSCMTLAQLIAENETQRREVERLTKLLDGKTLPMGLDWQPREVAAAWPNGSAVLVEYMRSFGVLNFWTGVSTHPSECQFLLLREVPVKS